LIAPAVAAAPELAGVADVARPGTPSASRPAQTALLLLAEFAPRHWPWAWSRLALRDRPLRGTPGLRLAKVLGSGHGGGFGLRPSPSSLGLFCVLDDDAAADALAAPAGPLQAWRDRAAACFSVRLRAFSSRGSWSGVRLEVTAAPPSSGPVASLTRASIRPTRAAAFWRMEPAAERALHAADGCLLAAGVGEAPLLRQATFSVWRDPASMDAYARRGAHRAAIDAAARGGFFSESMFVRFVPYDAHGTWRGRRLDA
jgi:spheroidene monooxygenase